MKRAACRRKGQAVSETKEFYGSLSDQGTLQCGVWWAKEGGGVLELQ